ncbi:Methyl-accepting chemotaxis sensor/transducer protein [hydrothermal vent metagenome]|uniref:Methyl-accepting chemotaxis sensor/transducer protein n=1 Tax=hydrothermal vent metagenome TaxID=652676 RepID=A0A3B0ZU62_9ZZZZ
MATLTSSFLSPSVAILNKLKLTWKFALIFVLYLVPVAYIIFLSITEQTKSISQARLERTGLQYMAKIRPLFEHMAQTRGMTNAYLQGKPELKQNISEIRSTVNKELAELIKIDLLLGETLKTTALAKAIQRDWYSVIKNAYSMSADKSFTEHSIVIEKLLSLKAYVLESSRLLLDPSLDSNFMASALSIRIPELAENIGKARGLGTGIIATGNFTSISYLKLNNFIQNIKNSNNAMMHGFDVVFENNTAIQDSLLTLKKNAANATIQFISLTKKNVLQPKKMMSDSKRYFEQGTQAIKTNLELYDAVIPVLDKLLSQRITEEENNIIINIISSLMLLLGALYIFGGFQRSIMNSINSIKIAVHDLAEGDLTTHVKLDAQDEMQSIAEDMNMMIERINALVSQVISSANQVVDSAEQSGTASKETSNGVNQQTQELELVATAMNEMSATVHEVAKNASSTAEATRKADKEANNGRMVVNQTIKSINKLSTDMQQASNVIKQLEEDSDSIGSVLDVIRGIADQTNLLALNAAIEAARAGEQGRGFAVVADEVRTLASRTQDSTKEIQTMIEKLQLGAANAVKVMDDGTQQTEKTITHAAEAGTALESITSAVEHITSMNEQIASAAEEQSSVAEEINHNIVNVRDIAEQTVSNADMTAESSDSLRSVASQLQHLVSEFKVN